MTKLHILRQAAEVGQVMAIPQDLPHSDMYRHGAEALGTCFSPHCHCVEACSQFEHIVDDRYLQVAGG